MAKPKKKPRPEERTSPAASTHASALLAAFRAYDAGNIAAARRAAQGILAREPSAEDLAAARQLGKQLELPGEPDPHALARRLLEDAQPPTKAYALGLLALLVAALLTALALARY